MRQISNANKDSPVRIVGLCTSLANAKDLGEWIGASAHGLFNFPPGLPPHRVVLTCQATLRTTRIWSQPHQRPGAEAACLPH